MDAPDFIVEKLIAVRPDGRRFDVTIRVGKPYADDGPNACLVQVDPFDPKPLRTFGEGPMQALFLGLRLVRRRLIAEEEDRGVRFFFQTGEDVDVIEPCYWRHFWYGDPAQPTAG